MVLPSLPRRSDSIALDEDAFRATAVALRRDGFAAVPGLFSRDEVRDVERLLDRALLEAEQTPAARPFLVRYPRKGALAEDAGPGRGLGGWDQIELNGVGSG